jgi:WD40 repeat protein
MRVSLTVVVVAVSLLAGCGGGDAAPDGVRISETPTVRIVATVSDDAEVLRLDPHAVGVMFVAWSPDGTLLATSDGLDARVWDVSGTLVAELATGPASITALSWSADSQRLATGDSGGVVSLWGRDGVAHTTFAVSDDRPPAPVASVVWSPVGSLLATGVVQPPDSATPGSSPPTFPATVQLWQADGREVQSFEIAYSFRGVVNLSWSSDGTRLAAGGNDIHVWDTSGEELFLDEGGEFHFRPSLAFSPSGELLAFTDVAGIIHIQPVDGGPPLSGGTVAVDRAVVFSPDSSMVAVATDHLVIVLGADDPIGRRVNAITSGVQSAPAWSPDSRLLAAGVARRAVQVVTAEGEDVAIMPGCEAMVTAVAWSPDGARLAAGFADGQVCVWEVPTAR